MAVFAEQQFGIRCFMNLAQLLQHILTSFYLILQHHTTVIKSSQVKRNILCLLCIVKWPLSHSRWPLAVNLLTDEEWHPIPSLSLLVVATSTSTLTNHLQPPEMYPTSPPFFLLAPLFPLLGPHSSSAHLT